MTSTDDLGRVLRVAPHLTLTRHPEWGVAFLVGEREHYVLRGAEALAVLEQLDGARSVGRLLDACAEVPPERVLYVLAQLEAQGFVEPVRGGDLARQAFEAGLGVRPPAPESEPEEAPEIELADVAEASGVTRVMVEALRAAGFEIVACSERGGTRVIVTDDYLAPDCIGLAHETLRSGRACFLVKPTGLRPFIGPFFTGAEGQACPICLADALREQRPVERVVERAGERRPVPPRASIRASVAAAANLAAIELRAALARPERAAMPRLRALDYARFELTEHSVHRRPQCPGCGDAKLQATMGERPVTLSPVPIGFDADGGSRREPPVESYARLRHLVSPLLGPVTYLHPTPGRRVGAHPVFSSGYLVAPQRGADASRFDRHCAGKGCSEDQARMSALAEALERYSGVYRGDEACRLASFDELDGEALLLDDLQLFSAAQRAAGSAPPMLTPGTRIAWTPAWSLREARRRWAPLAYCYAEAPAEIGAAYCVPSSNGSAAGNCLEEAVLQGLYEAIERDAVAIWWYGRLRRPEARPGPVHEAYLEERRRGYEALGWSLWALDLTHDVGLPVIVAVAVHKPSDRLALGFGAHHDAGLALRRAVCELDQVFDPPPRAASPWQGMTASELGFVRPDPEATSFGSRGPVAGLDLKELIEAWVARLGGLGLDTLVVDKTRPDVGLCVAQVIIPGLRHPWPRFAPGRLYSVPVALGLGRPLSEDELNPRPLLV